MASTAPRRLDWHRTSLSLLCAVVLLTLPVTLLAAIHWWQGGFSADYWTLQRAAADAGQSALYASDYGYRWSPVGAWLLLALPPLPVWIGLHVAALALLRDWRLICGVLLSFSFMLDATLGNVITFVVIAAWWAMRGNQWATGIYLVLVLLMPRPLMLPVAAWLLWQRPEWRLPFAALFSVHLLLVAWSGLGEAWLRDLATLSSEESHPLNWGPSRFIGTAWVPLGLALGAWLTWKGRLGWASLAVSPYLFPYYLLFGLLELRPRDPVASPLLSTTQRRVSLFRLAQPGRRGGSSLAHSATTDP
jgi:hypothetical protein